MTERVKEINKKRIRVWEQIKTLEERKNTNLYRGDTKINKMKK